MPSAAIFDLDGTLLDTLDDLADSANEALGSFGYAVHPVEAYRTFVGDGMAVLMERILPAEARGAEDVARLLTNYKAAYDRRWKSKTRLYPGIFELIATLNERGIPLAILSNKPQAYTEVVMGHFFPDHRFDLIFGQRETVRRKPHPDGALEIADHWKLDPAEIIFIGDTSTDMDTATAAGMIPVGVLWGFRQEEELRKHGARFLVRTPGEILSIFE
ncbi:MAG: haloacid dehalogenase superfamily enzyme subfamily [Verrucomicrobiales bacterium]|nr:haloacid dehalogenase superfamily enzyme subfamily [Verrucomicrobiales bacterium]